MPAPQYFAVNTNTLASTAFLLERSDQRWALEVPSLGRGNQITLEFTATSGTAPFQSLQRIDGTGQVYTVYSGTGPAFAMLPQAPTPWGRLALSSGPTVVATFTIFTLNTRW